MLFHPTFFFDALYGKYWPAEGVAKYNMIIRDLCLMCFYESYSFADTDQKRNYIKWRVKKLYENYYENNKFNPI